MAGRWLDDGGGEPAEALGFWGIAATAPPSGSPAATPTMPSRWRRIASMSRSGGACAGGPRRPAVVPPGLAAAAVDDDADVQSLAALDARDDAPDRVLEGVVRRGHGAPPRPRSRTRAERRGARRSSSRRSRARAPGRRRASRRARRRRSPLASRDRAATPAARRPRRSAGEGQQDMVGDQRERGLGAPSGHVVAWWRYSAAPWSISHSSSCQINMLGLRGVRSTLAVSASSQTIAAASSGVTPTGAAGRRAAAGQEVERRVDAAAGLQSPGSLGPARRPRAAVDLDEHDLRDAQAQRARDLADDHLGDQRLRALPGAAELHDVEAVVVGLHQAGDRAAFAQRDDVARGAHGAQSRGVGSGMRRRTVTPALAATVLRSAVVRRRQPGPDGGPSRVRRAARRRRPVRAAALPWRRVGADPAAVHRRGDRGDRRGPAQRRRVDVGRAAADPARLRAGAGLGDARRTLAAGAAGDPAAGDTRGPTRTARAPASSRRCC